jgi:hypothetical protein
MPFTCWNAAWESYNKDHTLILDPKKTSTLNHVGRNYNIVYSRALIDQWSSWYDPGAEVISSWFIHHVMLVIRGFIFVCLHSSSSPTHPQLHPAEIILFFPRALPRLFFFIFFFALSWLLSLTPPSRLPLAVSLPTTNGPTVVSHRTATKGLLTFSRSSSSRFLLALS